MNENDKPLITVITLCYYSKYLKETIHSVLNQTYENIQYIISDDGSRDFNKAEIQEYINTWKKANIKEINILHHIENAGTVKNVNGALKHAKGEYIFYLSGDDLFYHNDILKQWVAEFRLSNADIMTAYQVQYDIHMERLLKIIPSPHEVNKIKKKSPSALYMDLTKGNYILGSVIARTRSSFEQYGLYDESYILLEDYPMILYLLRQNQKIEFWNQIAIKYRDGGISNAENYNPVYKRDCDLVFEKEIKKYAPHKLTAIWRYQSWNKRQKKMGEFLNKYSNCKNVLEKILLYFCYPKRGIEKIIFVILQRGRK